VLVLSNATLSILSTGASKLTIGRDFVLANGSDANVIVGDPPVISAPLTLRASTITVGRAHGRRNPGALLGQTEVLDVSALSATFTNATLHGQTAAAALNLAFVIDSHGSTGPFQLNGLPMAFFVPGRRDSGAADQHRARGTKTIPGTQQDVPPTVQPTPPETVSNSPPPRRHPSRPGIPRAPRSNPASPPTTRRLRPSSSRSATRRRRPRRSARSCHRPGPASAASRHRIGAAVPRFPGRCRRRTAAGGHPHPGQRQAVVQSVTPLIGGMLVRLNPPDSLALPRGLTSTTDDYSIWGNEAFW